MYNESAQKAKTEIPTQSSNLPTSIDLGAPAQAGQLGIEAQTPYWSLATRVAFRFCFLYFGLYCISSL